MSSSSSANNTKDDSNGSSIMTVLGPILETEEEGTINKNDMGQFFMNEHFRM